MLFTQNFRQKICRNKFGAFEKIQRGASPPQAARRKASAVSPFVQRLILKLNFTFQRSGRGMLAVFENII